MVEFVLVVIFMFRFVLVGDMEFVKDVVFGYKVLNICEVNVFLGFFFKKDGIVIFYKKMLFSFILIYLYFVCWN